jgi:BirA family biotin operon repressor/biotin-[acetyl-CoA-carboxylase] ligase
MFEDDVEAALRDLPLGGLRVFQSLGSTNDEALRWASDGAADLSLVVADEQTAGRGRGQRRWYTPRGTALALSLILRSFDVDQTPPGRLAGLGALAICSACEALGLQPAVKWPNDVLLDGKKVAGVLVETVWNGNVLRAAVVGLGVNVLDAPIPTQGRLLFPATSIAASHGRAVDRMSLLRALVEYLLAWRPRLHSADFLRAWEDRLAFRGEEVVLTREGQEPIAATLLGLESDGSLRLEYRQASLIVPMGEIHLRTTNDRMG